MADELTAREREVLGLVLRGLTPKQIAVALGITPRTASTHIDAIRRKRRLHRVVDLVRQELQQRLVGR